MGEKEKGARDARRWGESKRSKREGRIVYWQLPHGYLLPPRWGSARPEGPRETGPFTSAGAGWLCGETASCPKRAAWKAFLSFALVSFNCM